MSFSSDCGNTSAATTRVMEAAQRTIAARTARLVLQQRSADTLPHVLGTRVGCHPAAPVFLLMRLASKHAPEVLEDTGWVDLVGRRYELDSGHFMVRGRWGAPLHRT
jgi:hypothetical protein